MDKINEVMLAVTSGVVALGVFLFKRIFTSIDIAHERVDKLESEAVNRQFLENQLAPIRADLNIITEHLINRK